MQKIVLILFIAIWVCCENRSQSKFDATMAPEVRLLDSINVSLDTVTILYKMAIFDVENGKDVATVVSNYEDKIRSLHTNISLMMDSISGLFVRKEKSVSEYDEFMKRIELEKVNDLSGKLEKNGVRFELDQMPDCQ